MFRSLNWKSRGFRRVEKRIINGLFTTILSTVSSISIIHVLVRTESDDSLMGPKSPLRTLAATLSFEVCIGMNGKLWINSGSGNISEGIALKRVLERIDAGELGEEKDVLERALKEYLA
jgi:exosome complex RNA-binding protein Rrp4